MDWDWTKFHGSAPALKYAQRDLATVDHVLSIVKGRHAVVQAGGNLGIFPKYLSRHFHTVYTFEPDPDLFRMMTLNAPEQNILRYQAALGTRRELVGTSMTRRDDKRKLAHEGVTHVVPNGDVPTLRVDDLGLLVCDLLYLDVEGYELDALTGAVETLTRCRPVVVAEINQHINFYGHSGEDVRKLLTSLEYKKHSSIHSDEVFVPI